jgi:hypothetical protein
MKHHTLAQSIAKIKTDVKVDKLDLNPPQAAPTVICVHCGRRSEFGQKDCRWCGTSLAFALTDEFFEKQK